MDWPCRFGKKYVTAGVDTGDSNGTTITTGGTHTKGTWQTLDASIPAGVVGLNLLQHGTADPNSANRWLVDIGIGSTPTIIANNLYMDKRVEVGGSLFPLPINLPSGVALKIRGQASTSSRYEDFSVLYEIAGSLSISGMGYVDTYGANTSNTCGVQIDPGGTANTKGSWSEITSGTTRSHKAILLCFGGDPVQGGTPARPMTHWLCDIGIGSPETVIIPNLSLNVCTLSDALLRDVFGPFEIDLPSGTRIAARMQCDITDADDRLLDLVVLGFS